MEGREDRSVNGRKGGWIVSGRKGGWMGEWMDRWVDGWINGWTDGWVDGWMDGQTLRLQAVHCHMILKQKGVRNNRTEYPN